MPAPDRKQLVRDSYVAFQSGDRAAIESLFSAYESTKSDGKRLRNTEIHTFDGDRICKVEVYFGWNL